jgi:hypothetical protein
MKPRKNVDETGKRETGATKEPFLFGLCLPGEFLCELQSLGFGHWRMEIGL